MGLRLQYLTCQLCCHMYGGVDKPIERSGSALYGAEADVAHEARLAPSSIKLGKSMPGCACLARHVLQAEATITSCDPRPRDCMPCGRAAALTRRRTRLRHDLDDLPGHGAPYGAQRQGVRLLARRLPRSCAAPLRGCGLLPVLHFDHARDAVGLEEHLPARAWRVSAEACPPACCPPRAIVAFRT